MKMHNTQMECPELTARPFYPDPNNVSKCEMFVGSDGRILSRVPVLNDDLKTSAEIALDLAEKEWPKGTNFSVMA